MRDFGSVDIQVKELQKIENRKKEVEEKVAKQNLVKMEVERRHQE